MKRGSDGYSKYPYYPKSLVKVWKSNSFKSFRTVSVYLIATSQQLEQDWLSPVYSGRLQYIC